MTKFLYILIFISNLSIAQIPYSHYINETSVWRFEAHRWLTQSVGCGGMCGINSTAYVTEYIDGTSNINGYLYYKLYGVSIQFGMTSPVYGPIYIREDSNGKFYFLDYSLVEAEYFDNNLIQNVQNGSPINNNGSINTPTLCTAEVSYITIDGLSLKKVKSVGYKIEGIATSRHLNGLFGGGICSGVTYTIQQNGTWVPHDYDLLFSYTKNGSTYVESSTGGNISNYPVPTYLNTTSYSYNIDETKIFPNPTYDKINIQSESRIRLIDIIDIQGRKLETIISDDFETQINMSKFQNGTYIFKIETELGSIVKKVIKN